MRARRLAFCRRCNRDTPQAYLTTDQPSVELWRCECGATLMSIADIPDADGFAIAVADKWIRRNAIVVGVVEREEVHGEARMSLWVSFTKWEPSRGLSFRSYASWKTGALLTDWIREQRGRTYGDDRSGLKAHSDAISLDIPFDSDSEDPGATRLDGLVSASAGNAATVRSPDLTRALTRRGRGGSRGKPAVGVPPYARAS